ncbi:MAG TPA: SGNH/GDSL hydrolase family protein [Candidatus Anaerobutyricum stercoris]|uniref:SGNH/GDSL hydrolase family protein n=1 Tax=Candidatus Anaerobutyricum stercoris TaxID=2838457 RepID=A0A9D2EKD1_9FIRM|nr:SGNH/GDSL hydrolase family protein [Candidatus Anaerobutyricum stercoris]
MKDQKKRISILGDSVSTFAGITPSEALFYDAWRQEETGVTSPDDTWWMQVIQGMGGILGVNNSYAGSTVSGGFMTSGTSEKRLRTLSAEGEPDMILVAMGANDWGFGVHPQEFEYEYRRMLQRMKRLYPRAEIWCATILRGKPVPEEEMFFNVDGVISPNIYSDIIRRIGTEEAVHLADVSGYHMEYETIDGVHPNREGMKMIACLWLKELQK